MTSETQDGQQPEAGEAQPEQARQQQAQQRPVDIPGGVYQQRPAPASNPGRPGYNSGSYAGGSYGPQVANETEGRSLVVGPGINMSGEIDACDHLVVEGTVEAALKGARVLDIAETGTFYGAVEIEEATVAGRFEGDLTVNGRLTIKDTGSVTGSISYKELAIEAGAVVDGKISPLKEKGAGTEKKPQKQQAETGADREQAKPAQGGELPFADKASAA